MYHPVGIVVGKGVVVGNNCSIFQSVTLGLPGYTTDAYSFPVVGDDVILGAGAVLLGPISVGSRARVGANSVVTTDVPANSVVAGIPARVIRRQRYETVNS